MKNESNQEFFGKHSPPRSDKNKPEVKISDAFLYEDDFPFNLDPDKPKVKVESNIKNYHENLQYIEKLYFDFVNKIFYFACGCTAITFIVIILFIIFPLFLPKSTLENIPYSTIEVILTVILTTSWTGLIVNIVLGFIKIHAQSASILKEKNKIDDLNKK